LPDSLLPTGGEIDGPSRAAVTAAYGAGALVVLGLALALLAIPIQVSDSFGNMLKLSTPWPQFVVQEFTQPSYLRPFLWMQLKAVHDVSGGHYYAWFRGVHVLQVIVLVGLYLHLIRPRTWRGAAAVPLGLAVLVGHHAFTGTVNEAFPINTFLTIVICCLAAAALALGKERRTNSVLAVLLFAYAALSVESGLLVFVVFAAAAVTGARGVPRAGTVALVAALAGYFALRFAVLDVGTPSLSERASGFGFSVLDPPELARRFTDRRLAFYTYNVVASALSVVFGEPRGGVYRLTDGLRLGAPYPSLVATAVASTAASILIAVFAWRRLPAWRAWQLTHDDRLVLLFLALLPANAVISFPYTKDVIMSPAAAFMALAAGVAARHLLIPATGGRGRVLALAACLLLSLTWSVRLLSLHVELRVAQHKVREEWAYVDDWIALQRLDVSDPHARALRDALRDDALITRRPAGELAWARWRLFY
jgi:hypothetical protein